MRQAINWVSAHPTQPGSVDWDHTVALILENPTALVDTTPSTPHLQAMLLEPAGHRQRRGIHQVRVLRGRHGRGRRDNVQAPHGLGGAWQGADAVTLAAC